VTDAGGVGKLLRTNKCEAGVMGPKPNWLRRVSSAQGKSLWMIKAPSALLTGMDREALEKLRV
jgi:hypothetical protein